MPYLIIPLVSFLAGMTNAIAGGGTFFTFPALTGIGKLTEQAANVTSTIGLWPGGAASVGDAPNQAPSPSLPPWVNRSGTSRGPASG